MKDIKGPGVLTATVTPEIEEMMKDKLNLEIEMLQGTRKVLKSGMIKYKIEVTDDDKCQMIISFILRVIAKDAHSDESKN